MKRYFIIVVLIMIFGTFLYSYSQYSIKKIITAHLQQNIDISNPPPYVSAISAYDQSLSDGTKIPKGTIFTGMLSKETGNVLIYFDSVEFANGKKSNLYAKTNLNISESKTESGVSAKIGKTLYKQTKTNVLGAIFHTSNSGTNEKLLNSILPQGLTLKIEVQ